VPRCRWISTFTRLPQGRTLLAQPLIHWTRLPPPKWRGAKSVAGRCRTDRARRSAFVNHIATITQGNAIVSAQVAENSKEQALKGNLPGAVQQAVVRAMTSNISLATHLLKEDRQSIGMLTSMIYDILKSGEAIDVEALQGR
jgi:hypothetical protein